MKISTCFIILLAVISFHGCQNKSNEFENKIKIEPFENLLQTHGLNRKSFNKIIIIPNAGCDGCISDVERKFVKSFKSLDTLYIFTRIADLKLFNNSLPREALKSKNVLIDTGNLLDEFGFYSMYPSIIENTAANPLISVPFTN